MKSKLIGILGSPCSGKSTLASQIHTQLKMMDKNSIFISEVATDYIAEYGIPKDAIDQMTIYYKQSKKERMYFGSKEYIICDSSSILNYFYFRTSFSTNLTPNNIATINNIQKEILTSLNTWTHLFYVPPIDVDGKDGIRFHSKKEIDQIDANIKAYLNIENIPYIDLSNIELDKRVDNIIKIIT